MKAAACLKGSPAVAAVALLLLLYYYVVPYIDKYLEVTKHTNTYLYYLSNYPLYTAAID